jgi:hypothetical protein
LREVLLTLSARYKKAPPGAFLYLERAIYIIAAGFAAFTAIGFSIAQTLIRFC